jgi:DNA-binding transcriptional regulator YbjK
LRRRDPQARREALLTATIEVIAEAGIGRTTHRAVAARAQIPLGATTYYFPTLADLIEAALRHATDALRAELDAWSARLRAGDLPGTLIGLATEYLSDRSRALLECELYLAAAHDERLRPLAREWRDGMHELLTPLTDAVTARALTMLVDGALEQAVATGEPLDSATLRHAITRLIR